MLAYMLSLSSPSWEPSPYTGQDGLYCAVQPDDATKFRVIRLCEDLGVVTDYNKLHCTIVYSREVALTQEVIDTCKNHPTGRITFIEYWSGHNNAGYLVAHVVSESAHMFHERLLRAGAEHTYNPYNPHMTLCKGLEMTDVLQASILEVNKKLAKESIYANFEGYTVCDISED